jgi:tRNA(fMet)-specific endonuclease VapC
MISHVLDTDTVSLHHRGHPTIRQHVSAHPPGEIAITVITVEEQLSGWYTLLRRAKQAQRLALAYQSLADSVRWLARYPILSFTVPAIARYQQLKAQKLGVGTKDLRIAAIALEVGAILVTRNTRDFQRVPNLLLEDWTV